jgi:hypothetical protein
MAIVYAYAKGWPESQHIPNLQVNQLGKNWFLFGSLNFEWRCPSTPLQLTDDGIIHVGGALNRNLSESKPLSLVGDEAANQPIGAAAHPIR